MERALAALAPRWSVAAPDLYGHGHTPCPEDMSPETLLERQVAVLLALLDLLGGPARVVGHSYGAVLALSLAATAPARVRDLVLVEPVAFGLLAADDPALAPVHAVEAECRALVLAGDPAVATRRFLDFWSDPELWDFLPEADRLAIVAGARERHFIGGPAVFGAPSPPPTWPESPVRSASSPATTALRLRAPSPSGSRPPSRKPSRSPSPAPATCCRSRITARSSAWSSRCPDRDGPRLRAPRLVAVVRDARLLARSRRAARRRRRL
ncbi:alpha/beta fold hydrolase [Nannocystis pusilla]|uniref:alpha/beta fold hydrolase n=1 Tax=Nannocystis pusilla TaxID=889268 RepID=UPI003B82026B